MVTLPVYVSQDLTVTRESLESYVDECVSSGRLAERTRTSFFDKSPPMLFMVRASVEGMGGLLSDPNTPHRSRTSKIQFQCT